MKILVVEDDLITKKLLVSILEQSGYQVSTAGTGREAIMVLDNDSGIDLIISDIQMPVMNGFDMLQYVKADARLRRIPVIISSSNNDSKSVMTSIDLGASDFITKPINKELLVQKVKKAMAKLPGDILVVDDEELLLDLFGKILTRSGFKVILCNSPLKALDILKQKKISVVISDIQMPEMSGFELCIQIKKIDKQMPVLLMTGHGSEYNNRQVISGGADDYITKPFKNTEIIKKISGFIK